MLGQHGTNKIHSHFCLGYLVLLLILIAAPAAAQTADWYVDGSVAQSGAGTSWQSPFKYLPDALGVAQAGEVVWVAEWTYYPDECVTCGVGGTDLQTDSFDVPLEVKVYGGFPTGGGNGTFGARNPALFETVLSGDIDQDDANSPANDPSDIQGANSFHVLTIVNVVNPDPQFDLTVVDGVTITAGNAEPPRPRARGRALPGRRRGVRGLGADFRDTPFGRAKVPELHLRGQPV